MLKKMIAFTLIFLLMFSIIGCNKEEKKVVIASKPMTEQYVIAEMLKLLIEANSDIAVELKLGIGGGTSNIQPAMEKGEIDIYPEYTGTGWMFVLKEELINNSEELYKSVKKAYEEQYGIKWTGLYGFNDTYGLAIKKELADKLNIKTYSDLALKSDSLTLGAEYDFYEREDGYPGLSEIYGFRFDNKTELDIGLKYQAISTDQVDVINVFSTDGRLKEKGLVVLQDDKNFFPPYFAATLVREETLKEYPELEKILEMMTGLISNEDMIEMNYLVEIDKKDPKEVAREFLEKKGLK